MNEPNSIYNFTDYKQHVRDHKMKEKHHLSQVSKIKVSKMPDPLPIQSGGSNVNFKKPNSPYGGGSIKM